MTCIRAQRRLPPVLGAIAAARECGVSLAEAATGLAGVRPFEGRMEPCTLPGGAVIWRDDYDGSIDSFEMAARALGQARAKRRILVVGDCSDFRKTPRERIKRYARVAWEMAGAVVFLGERCEYGVRRAMREGFEENAAHGFISAAEEASWLRGELSEGDLVLVRGTHAQHLSRLYYRLIGSVQCDLPACRLRRSCDDCPQLGSAPRRELAPEAAVTLR